MRRKKSGKLFTGAFLHFEKRESRKDKKGKKESQISLTVKSTIIASMTFLTLLITLLKGC
jgi:hypothetical protein